MLILNNSSVDFILFTEFLLIFLLFLCFSLSLSFFVYLTLYFSKALLWINIILYLIKIHIIIHNALKTHIIEGHTATIINSFKETFPNSFGCESIYSWSLFLPPYSG